MSHRPAWTLDTRPLGETPLAGAFFPPRGANGRGVAFAASPIKFTIGAEGHPVPSSRFHDVSAARQRTVLNSTASNQAIVSNRMSRDVGEMRSWSLTFSR